MGGDSRYSTATACLIFLAALSIGNNYASDDLIRRDPERAYYRKSDGLFGSTELVIGIDGSTSVVKRPFPIFGKSVMTDIDGDGRVDEIEYSNPFQKEVFRRIDQINSPDMFEAASAELGAQKKRFRPMIGGYAMIGND
jgi:hypothetical protein